MEILPQTPGSTGVSPSPTAVAMRFHLLPFTAEINPSSLRGTPGGPFSCTVQGLATARQDDRALEPTSSMVLTWKSQTVFTGGGRGGGGETLPTTLSLPCRVSGITANLEQTSPKE